MPTNPEKVEEVLTVLDQQIEEIEVAHTIAVERQLLLSGCVFILLALGSHQEKIKFEYIDNDYLLIVVAICFLVAAYLETYKIEKGEAVEDVLKDIQNTEQLNKDLKALQVDQGSYTDN